MAGTLSTLGRSAADYQEDSHIMANMYGNLIKKSLAAKYHLSILTPFDSGISNRLQQKSLTNGQTLKDFPMKDLIIATISTTIAVKAAAAAFVIAAAAFFKTTAATAAITKASFFEAAATT